jgi:hypothetical protein
VSEFSSGVPPATVESGVGSRPKTVGLIVRSVMVPSFRSQILGDRQSSGGQYKEASRKRQRGNVQKSRRPD